MTLEAIFQPVVVIIAGHQDVLGLSLNICAVEGFQVWSIPSAGIVPSGNLT